MLSNKNKTKQNKKAIKKRKMFYPIDDFQNAGLKWLSLKNIGRMLAGCVKCKMMSLFFR